MADIDVKLRCPERLIFNETLKRCDWPETTACKTGTILVEEDDQNGYCSDKVIRFYEKAIFLDKLIQFL